MEVLVWREGYGLGIWCRNLVDGFGGGKYLVEALVEGFVGIWWREMVEGNSGGIRWRRNLVAGFGGGVGGGI